RAARAPSRPADRPLALSAGGASRSTRARDRHDRAGGDRRRRSQQPRRAHDCRRAGKDRGVRNASDTAIPIHLEFDDNLLLPPLFGEHDRHIARIEQLLGVSLSSRGNRVAIAGAPSRAAAARDALLALYQRLKRGHAVDVGDVDAAVRLAEQGEGDGADLFGGGELAIRTRKRVVGPRSANQALYLKTLRERELVFAL